MSDWSELNKEQWAEEGRAVDDLKDAWDDEEEVEEVEEEKVEEKKPEKPAVKQLTKKEALKKAIELKEKEEKESRNNPASEFDIYMEEKRRKELQEAADLENSRTLFSGVSVRETTPSEPIGSFVPKTEKEFEKYADIVSDYLTKYDSSIHYASFFKHLIKKSLANVPSNELNDISKALTVVINEKIKNEKAGKGKKTTKATAKKSLQMGSELENYDDFDDFM
ncbi:hypothetical protein DICPUDRAFT_99600 [Dictyostelium purpureum]|uniref:Eukaryotic translation initiation factor 3 subunit J n=1 Tax=Dictyostelium purpureum TaxID=5786 RepID=F1A0Q3_DICPU|nr:uncharacterized protein DICPUDRAFT_99600 [Dictyostelium purpureum]EGC30232.1 hypothetical protein DICPUDRAFT_99600 [Dictyostelium purpureum]|eukprot:XP_003293246.1 hypothetical protein DICPUDRAFT_99600 [Dictyostelium purpureum]